MKKTFGIFLILGSLTVYAQDTKYDCSVSTKVEATRTNIFGGSPRVITTTLSNPCAPLSVVSLFVRQDGSSDAITCGAFGSDQVFITLRSVKLSEKNAKVDLIYTKARLASNEDYKPADVLHEKPQVEIGKEIVFEVSTDILKNKKSRRDKETIKKISVICQRKITI